MLKVSRERNSEVYFGLFHVLKLCLFLTNVFQWQPVYDWIKLSHSLCRCLCPCFSVSASVCIFYVCIYVRVSVCLYLCLYFIVFFCLSLSLFLCICFCLSVCLSATDEKQTVAREKLCWTVWQCILPRHFKNYQRTLGKRFRPFFLLPPSLFSYTGLLIMTTRSYQW